MLLMGRKPKTRRDSYGAWLHHLRKQAEMTQHELAEKTGLPQTTIAHWEITGNLPGREEILRLAQALDISVDELLRTDKARVTIRKKSARPSVR
jgi:transcriptional regulator with XRE-family HTH domain